MIKNKLLSTGLLALTVGVVGFGAGLATQGADAFAGENGEFKIERPALFEEIERELTYLDNGIQIEITSDNEEAVEKIQERHANEKAPKNANEHDVIRSVENITDGVIVTITSDDPDEVNRIQEFADEGPKEHGPKHGGEHHCEREEDNEQA